MSASLVLAALFACKLNTFPDQVVAIEVTLPDSGRVEVTDTFRPSARPLNGIGDSIAAEIYWSSLDTALLAVVDSATGVALAKAAGTARLQARSGALFSNPQQVSVLAKPDTIRPGPVTRDTVKLTPDSTEALDSTSAPLVVEVLAVGGVAGGRRVVYAVSTFPGTGPMLTLIPNDTVLTVAGTAMATATMRVRLRPGTRPDSVVVQASMTRLDSTLVPGSPVTFVVEFGP